MKAILLDRHGPPSVLKLHEVSEPVPGPGVVVRRLIVEALRELARKETA